MANKRITELNETDNIDNADLLLLETANGTRSISFENIKKPIDVEVEDAAKPHPFANNAAAHNGIFRGKDLTDVYTIDQIAAKIANGTFEDLYIGDYFDITITTSYTENENVRCVLAGFDTYLNTGNIEFTRHHAVIVPKNCFNKETAMNPGFVKYFV